MKQVGRIRRPFQAQAIALVMLCRFLADNFKAIGKSAVTVENVNSLDAYVLLLSTETTSSDLDVFTRAFDQTLVTLQAATKAVSELKTFNLTNFTNHATVKAFVEAEAVIQESFKSFKVSLIIFMVYVRSAEHLPHSSMRNGPRGGRSYPLRSTRT
jgi:hypothetical protein